ncbi:MAG: M28 family peptidase [Gemmatimonadales bacterium]
MFRPEVERALAAVTTEHAWSLIERFATLKREHPDDVETAAGEIVARLGRLGVPVTVHAPDLFLSLPGRASVRSGAVEFRAKPMAMSRATDGTTAPLLHIPNRADPSLEEFFTRPQASNLDDRVEGRIVLTEGFGMPGKVAHYEALGAAGMIAINPGANAHWGISSTVWGTPDLRDLPRKPGIPVVAVNNPDGLKLAAAAARGEVATINAAVEEGWYRSPIPVVKIPGTEEPESFVLLHGHYDSWDVGVGDNAVGDATLLEIARLLWDRRADLRRSVWIAWWPGHSTGRYAGSTWFADHYGNDLYRRCIAQVNCDSPGCRWATEYSDISWMSETESFCQSVIRAVAGKEARGERPFQAGDYSFNNIGISSYFMLLSTMKPEDRAAKGYYAVGGCGANIAWHTEDDTLEIADRGVLETDIKIYLGSVMQTANATIAPFDFSRTLAEFRRTLGDYQTQAGEAFSFRPAERAVDALEAAVTRLGERAASLGDRPASDRVVARINHAIRRLARHLVPVNFTTGPAFFHDQAEQIPPLPDLAVVGELADPARRGFALTHLTRGQNRLVAALEDARRDVEAALE